MAEEITSLLHRWSAGQPAALDNLVPVVYTELQRLARYMLRRERNHQTLQPTALVHEAFLRLVPQRAKEWQNREHFFAVCAQIMRQVLVDHARRRSAKKRGSGEVCISLEAAGGNGLATKAATVDVLQLDRALSELAEIDMVRARVVEMRYFAGMTLQEIGSVSGRPEWEVKKDWMLAKTWLKRRLEAV